MILTVSLLNKGSFLGSLINKCRQVVRIKPVKPIETNIKPNISNSLTTPTTASVPASTTPISTLKPTPTFKTNLPSTTISQTNRPAAVANISLSSSPSYAAKTFEEKLGLPPKPKKPLTPFFRFMQDQRPKIKAANPKLHLSDVVKQISKEWENADPSMKQRLLEQFKKDQQTYIETRTKYDSKITDEQRSQIKELKQELSEAKERRMMRKRIKELGRPKKPASAFLRFIAKERVATPQTSKETFREWHQKATARWKTLAEEQKNVYLVDARKELDKYKLVKDRVIINNFLFLIFIIRFVSSANDANECK